MKALLYGQDSKNIEQLVKELDLDVVTKDPDVVISYGGDGTLLSSERDHPGIPKLPIRNSQFCNKCSKHQDELVLKKLFNGHLKLREHKKLHTNIYGKDLFALNDFVIRNSHPTHTIRFKVTIPSHPELDSGSINNQLLIGDGVVIATPFGATGYFKSITEQIFDKGFGIAFNNTTEKISPIILKDEDTFTFQLLRGKATLSMDNNPDIFTIDEGSQIFFKLSHQVAKIYEDTSLRCPKCQVIRG